MAKPSARIEDRLLEYREARRREARPLEGRDLHAILATASGQEPIPEGEGAWRVALEGGEVPVVYEPETGDHHLGEDGGGRGEEDRRRIRRCRIGA